MHLDLEHILWKIDYCKKHKTNINKAASHEKRLRHRIMNYAPLNHSVDTVNSFFAGSVDLSKKSMFLALKTETMKMVVLSRIRRVIPRIRPLKQLIVN